MRLRSTIKVDKRFSVYSRRGDAAVVRALAAAGRIGAATSAAAAQERRRTGAMADVRLFPVLPLVRGGGFGIRHGYDVGWVSRPHYSLFQEHGTLAGRKRKLKASTLRRQATPSGQARRRTGGGIKPLRFMSRGRTAGRRALVLALRREWTRVR